MFIGLGGSGVVQMRVRLCLCMEGGRGKGVVK